MGERQGLQTKCKLGSMRLCVGEDGELVEVARGDERASHAERERGTEEEEWKKSVSLLEITSGVARRGKFAANVQGLLRELSAALLKLQ